MICMSGVADYAQAGSIKRQMHAVGKIRSGDIYGGGNGLSGAVISVNQTVLHGREHIRRQNLP